MVNSQREQLSRRPVAVIISDVHYNLQTLSLADAAVRQAIEKANDLNVPLIVAGDLHDTKANMRGECMNAMITTFYIADTPVLILRGNHCAINEKSEQHVLGFLRRWSGMTESYAVDVIDCPRFSNKIKVNQKSVHFIPYQHDPEAMRAILKKIEKGSCIIMHQGIEGSHSGDYIQDKSAINKEDVADFRVISGHYHRRQDIKCGRPQKGAVGLFSYIGNPYTLNYAEASDPSKGFQVLYDDGLMEHVPTNLREHKVMNLTFEDLKGEAIFLGEPQDLLWVKITGTKEQLAKLSKSQVATDLDIEQDFRLDLIPTETKTNITQDSRTVPQAELLDSMIDSVTGTSDERKERLKTLWKELK